MPPQKSSTTSALRSLWAALSALPPVRTVLDDPRSRHRLGELWGSAANLTAALLAKETRGCTVLITPTVEDGEAVVLDLKSLHSPIPSVFLPPEEKITGDGPEQRANLSERLVALSALDSPDPHLLVVPSPALLESLPTMEGPSLTLEQGQRQDRDKLVRNLIDSGYDRVPMVAAPGEISVRGDIVDLYPWASTAPVRLEFLDDEIEDLRRFDIQMQTSVENLSRIVLPRGGSQVVDQGVLTNILSPSTPVLLCDPTNLRDRLVERAFEADIPPRKINEILSAADQHPGIDFYPLALGDPQKDTGITSAGSDTGPLDEVITAWRSEQRPVHIMSATEAENDRLANLLTQRGCPRDEVSLHVGRITSGFALPLSGPVVVNHHELLGRRPTRRMRSRPVVVSRALEDIGELQPGVYVVHMIHGVGQYQGMKRLQREQGEEDFLQIEFSGETLLYVPASRIDLVERFIGAEGKKPKLDKIGGKSWSRKKERVSMAVADLATDLMDLQANRLTGLGFAHLPDDESSARFEAAFPYEDTPDQSQSWEEIRNDMESSTPMDRVLVGDVGFGKTEIAVRAAYKTVLGGKQVAILVPTTILAEQHYDTFAGRMAEEPLSLAVLSRFSTAKQQRAVLDDLKDRRVDIVIGTHRLLSQDVQFADLGLLIVDEEHRFGVLHKELLKRLRATVDVLTLSATPIPRTLHMAMSGLRDISSIRTPPPGRKSVITQVGYDDDATLKRAVLHEVHRGGQMFVLHNRVATIDQMLDRVSRLCPAVRAAIAHGQMAPQELRQTVEAFARGQLDVLVCTTIIESGVDIPRANTILVTNADRFGLADLHQLRGRVGREHNQAYAYFTVPENQPLSENSQRRLKAIQEFRSLGSGMPIALRDLELRGAGNLLGSEQSGHILSVGYDMYCRLLKKAVQKKRGEKTRNDPGELEVELGLSAYLPTDYIPNATQRMSLLRRLAAASDEGLLDLEREIVDRFGHPPKPARSLLSLFHLRCLVHLAGVTSILTDGLGGAILTVQDEKTYARHGPFHPPESYRLDATRMRLPWPMAVQTSEQRLEYLLERFSNSSPVIDTTS
ncbi:MAG: transcription-repair coupling factor [Planctomycetota bacterium]|nr:transcription-repair coupling factor [Planctomycetota bacterium]